MVLQDTAEWGPARLAVQPHLDAAWAALAEPAGSDGVDLIGEVLESLEEARQGLADLLDSRPPRRVHLRVELAAHLLKITIELLARRAEGVVAHVVPSLLGVAAPGRLRRRRRTFVAAGLAAGFTLARKAGQRRSHAAPVGGLSP